MATPYDKKDAAEDTDSTEKEVAEAWHYARDDMMSGGWRDGGGKDTDVSDWRDRREEVYTIYDDDDE